MVTDSMIATVKAQLAGQSLDQLETLHAVMGRKLNQPTTTQEKRDLETKRDQMELMARLIIEEIASR